jgi:hypothetical protein
MGPFKRAVCRNYGGMFAAQHFEPAGFKFPLRPKRQSAHSGAAEELPVVLPLASLVDERFVAAITRKSASPLRSLSPNLYLRIRLKL